MTNINDKVILAKYLLFAALGDNAQKYLNHMKLWFSMKWTKEEFDIASRKLLSNDTMHLHNQFFIAILNKIDSVASSNNSRSRFTVTERATFEPWDLLDFLKEDSLEYVRQPKCITEEPIPPQRYCCQEFFLPNVGFLLGRFLVGAWENNLIHVEDNVAVYVATAVQIMLKNFFTSIVLKRKHCRTTSDGNFFFDVGCSLKDPYTRNTVTRQKIDDGPMEIDKEITTMNVGRKLNDGLIFLSASALKKANDDSVVLSANEEAYIQEKKPINIVDVYNALRDRNMIPSHASYTLNMERLSQMLQ